jgi:cyclopropane fatty-acyl-phospholipid synthase-like methyltransferase
MNRTIVTDPERPWLGGNILGGDEMTYCPQVWDFLIDNFEPKSLLDVGCGEGYLMKYFLDRLIDVHGIDGLQENKNNSPVSIRDRIIVHDYTKGACNYRFTPDMVISCEFVEHVDLKYMENYILQFVMCKTLVMTHALPHQDGYHHVACQSDDYWIGIMKAFNMKLSPLTCQARKIAHNAGKILWETILIFE